LYGYKLFDLCVDHVLDKHIEHNRYPLNKLDSLPNYYENVSYLAVGDVNNSYELDEVIEQREIEAAISIRFNQIFSSALIEKINENGFFWNIHGGLLPEYRGLMSLYRAVQQNQKEVGWTVHEIDNNIDSGDIVDIVKVNYMSNSAMTILDYEIELSKIVPDRIIHNILNKLKGEKISASENLNELGQYYSNLSDEEVRRLKGQGIYFSSAYSYARLIYSLVHTKNQRAANYVLSELDSCLLQLN